MARKSEGPPAPTLAKVRMMIEVVEEAQGTGWEELLSILQWCEAFLDNRKAYHRRHTLKNRILAQMMREQLGEEGLPAVNDHVDKTMAEEYSSEEPE